MAKAKKISNEGLKVIFGDNLTDALNDIENFKEKLEQKEAALEVKVSKIRPNPHQPRRIFKQEELQELANSIKDHGLISPISVKKDVNGYTLIVGERRLRAHKLLKLKKIRVVISDITEQTMEEVALIENIQRENLNPIEEAIALKSLISKHNLTQEEVSKRIAKSRVYVTNSLRLLKLPKSVQKLVLDEKLTFGHVKVLLGLNSPELIIDVAKKALQNKWSVRKIESFVQKLKRQKTIKVINSKSKNLLYVEQLLREKLSTKVTIKNKKIIINYTSIKDLNRILEKMDALEK